MISGSPFPPTSTLHILWEILQNSGIDNAPPYLLHYGGVVFRILLFFLYLDLFTDHSSLPSSHVLLESFLLKSKVVVREGVKILLSSSSKLRTPHPPQVLQTVSQKVYVFSKCISGYTV